MCRPKDGRVLFNAFSVEIKMFWINHRVYFNLKRYNESKFVINYSNKYFTPCNASQMYCLEEKLKFWLK